MNNRMNDSGLKSGSFFCSFLIWFGSCQFKQNEHETRANQLDKNGEEDNKTVEMKREIDSERAERREEEKKN